MKPKDEGPSAADEREARARAKDIAETIQEGIESLGSPQMTAAWAEKVGALYGEDSPETRAIVDAVKRYAGQFGGKP